MDYLAGDDLRELVKEEFPALKEAWRGLEESQEEIEKTEEQSSIATEKSPIAEAWEEIKKQIKRMDSNDFSANAFVLSAEDLTKKTENFSDENEEPEKSSERIQDFLELSKNFSEGARSIISS